MEIDRVAPTRRPAEQVVMRQNWNHLLFLHWSVPAELLLPLLPPGLQLDTFEGKAYIGLVPFTMTGVRPIWTPSIPPLSNFHETNVRTYVHRNGCDPGVWFFSLDAANAIAVRIARGLWKLPYYFAGMRLTTTQLETTGVRTTATNAATETIEIEYASERLWPAPLPATCHVQCRPQGIVTSAQVGSLEHFLAERYILYAARAGHLYKGRVHHTPYPLQTATVSRLEENLLAASGIQRPNEAPLMHYARGVSVEIFPLRQILM